MITLIDGTKLPSHSELYVLWEKIFTNDLIKRLSIMDYVNRGILSFKRELDIDDNTELSEIKECCFKFLNHCKFGGFNYEFEDSNYWDILIYNSFFLYCIEYKSNVNEFNKEIHNFLSQINARRSTRLYLKNSVDRMDGIKILMSFDSRFIDYEDVLNKNNIRLLLLPQSMLELKNDILRHTKVCGFQRYNYGKRRMLCAYRNKV